jgi:hypothetical protein
VTQPSRRPAPADARAKICRTCMPPLPTTPPMPQVTYRLTPTVGGDKVRVNHQSLDSPFVILDNQALEVVASASNGMSAGHRGRPNILTSTR